MIPKYSVKRPYTVLVAVVLVIDFRSCFADEDDNRSAAGNESAVCDRCHNRCWGQVRRKWKRM